ncbi:MAG: DUF4185 domain-containing protein [Elusimicrobia bacterium]|nr:DUF4185 domain-containing protein [Elusimicrobiota bacterium]
MRFLGKTAGRAAATKAACVAAVILAFSPLQSPAEDLPLFSVSSGAPLLSLLPSTGAVVAQGGNFSVQLPDGRSLWVLNNVWTGEIKEGGEPKAWGLVDGAAAFVPSTSAAAQAGNLSWISDENGWPLPLLSAGMEESGQVRKFWPRSAVCGTAGCAVFYSIMNNFGPEPYDCFRVGQGVAVSADPAGPYVKSRESGRYSLWNDIEPAFGSAVLADEDGWVYVYGRVLSAPGEYSVQLARARPGDLASRAAYSYYSLEADTSAWTSDLAEASDIMKDMSDEFSVSYNDFLKAYLAVYSSAQDGGAMARLARYPWGPWGEPFRLFSCAAGDYCYGAKEQPGLAEEGGKRIYLTAEKRHSPYVYRVDLKQR